MLGDVLEWLAAGALVAGLYILVGLDGALFGAAGALFYLAQCYGATPLPFRRQKAPEQ